MGGFFSGLASGIGDHLHEQHLLALQQQVESKRNLLDNYNTLLKDPHMQDVHDQIAQALLKAAGTDPTKLHKQIGKPGGEFDPTQWQVLAQQRAAGRVPSPVNQGQNPTQIPAAPPGHEGAAAMGGGGQAQMAPAWNDATGVGVPLPPGAPSAGGVAASPSPDSPAGDGAGPQQPAPVAAAAKPLTPPPGLEQSRDALPPVQGNPVPDSASLASPSQAAAITPPPVDDWNSSHTALGGLTWQEMQRRANIGLASTEGVKNKAELERQTGLSAFNTQQDKQKIQNHIDTLKALGVWNTLNAREKAAVATGIQTLGNQPRPIAIPGNVPGSSAPEGQLDISGNELDRSGGIYHLRPNPATGEVDWIPQAVKKTLQWAADEDDPQKLKLYEVNPYNPQDKTAVKDLSKINAAMIPQVRNATQWKQVTQPDGSIALVPVSVSSTSTKTLSGNGGGKGAVAGAVPPPPARSATPAGTPPAPVSDGTIKPPKGSIIAGGRPLTPEQVITNGQKLGALDNTIEIVRRVQSNMPMLGSLLDAGKIQLQIDPNQGIFKAFINRSVPLSPKEAELAGDFASLMEHINTLRAPLGATGFRGEDAFNALQAQRGQLMANPAVTSQVLANTLKALNRTRQPIAQGLKRAGQDPDATTGGEGGGGAVELERGPDGKLRIKK